MAGSDAPSDNTGDWDSLDWDAIEAIVTRLQERIVKAQQAGKQGKVKALQRILTHSFAGRALAVKRVTENRGKKTPGVDRVIWNTPEGKMDTVHSLRPRGYRPLPLRRVNIPKSKTKTRPLGIPTMKDRAMQALYLLALDPIAECLADNNSFGFRKARSCADALACLHRILIHRYGAKWVLEGDIKGCFDNISHQWLMEHVPMDKTILRKWLKAGYMENKVLFPTDQGTPQGGIISPVLANMALDGLQDMLLEAFPKGSNKSRIGNKKVNLIRYADDFIITGDSPELLEMEVKPLVEKFMAVRGLELSPEKTLITHITGGFDFLGQNVRAFPSGTVWTQPSKKNLKTFLDKVREVIKEYASASAYALIAKLNPLIRGWANYHRHGASSKAFSYVDFHIFKALKRWAIRRHPEKPVSWVMRKYFASQGMRNWCFFGSNVNEDGIRQTNWLLRAASTRIVRHVSIKIAANPYDPAWKPNLKRLLATRAGLYHAAENSRAALALGV